jgi:hypothetical protein
MPAAASLESGDKLVSITITEFWPAQNRLFSEAQGRATLGGGINRVVFCEKAGRRRRSSQRACSRLFN